MTAFDQLENRLLALTLNRADPGVATRAATLSVGLFKSQPADNYDGLPGAYGEPRPQDAPQTYQRPRCAFTPVAVRTDGSDRGPATNAEALAFTGLSAGTYTHFGIFGNYVPYAAYGVANEPTTVFPGSNTPGFTAPTLTVPGTTVSPMKPAGGFAFIVVMEDPLLYNDLRGGREFNEASQANLYIGTPSGVDRHGVPRIPTKRPQLADNNPGPYVIHPDSWINDFGSAPLLDPGTTTRDGHYNLGAAPAANLGGPEQGTYHHNRATGTGFGQYGTDARVNIPPPERAPLGPALLRHTAALARYDRITPNGGTMSPNRMDYRHIAPLDTAAGNDDPLLSYARNPAGGQRRFDAVPGDYDQRAGVVRNGAQLVLRNGVDSATSGTYETVRNVWAIRLDHVYEGVPEPVPGTTTPGVSLPSVTVGGQSIPSVPIPPLIVPGAGQLPIGYVPLYWGTLATSVIVGGPSDVVVIPVGGLTVTAN